MKTSQRLLLVCYSLLMISVVAIFALLLCGVFGVDQTVSFIREINGSVFYTVCTVAVAIVLVVCSFVMMFIGTGKVAPSSTVIKAAEYGNIRVAIDTINAVALKTVKTVEAVRDCRVNTSVLENGLCINVKVALLNDSIIPEVTQVIQNTVKERLEGIIGMQIVSVPILVDNSIVSQNM